MGRKARAWEKRLPAADITGMLSLSPLMPHRSKLVAVILALLVFVPVAAAGRPACCVKTPAAAVAAHACCRQAGSARAMAPKPCCKTPLAPKPETKAKDAAPLAFMIPALDAGAPVAALFVLPEAVAVRLARRAHHAQAPDDSPPDLLERTSILLI
jgi:hypothetical protein